LVYQQDTNGEYQLQQFRGDERIVSGVFPELPLSMEQILTAIGD
jgi:Uma2 family endonuclease